MSGVLRGISHRQLALEFRVAETVKNAQELDMHQMGAAACTAKSPRRVSPGGMSAGELSGSTDARQAARQATPEVRIAPDEAPSGGHRAKMAKVAASAESVDEVRNFGDLAGRGDITTGCALSMMCVASDSTRRSAFCDMSGRPHFPASQEAVSIFFSWNIPPTITPPFRESLYPTRKRNYPEA